MNKPSLLQQAKGLHTYEEDMTGLMGSFNTVEGRIQFTSQLQNSKSLTNYNFQTENILNNSKVIVNKTENDKVSEVTDNFTNTKSKTIEDQKLLQNNKNNTIYDIQEEESNQQDSGMFHKINVAEAGQEEQDNRTEEDLDADEHGEHSQPDISHNKVHDNDEIQSDENTTSEEEEEEDGEEEEEEKPLISVHHSSKHLKIQSKLENDNEVSKSEVDLEGVYNAEQNEFIKVMVLYTALLTPSDRCREQKELQFPCQWQPLQNMLKR
jgi:hypothetical protein